MSVEIRPALPEEMEEFARVGATALAMDPALFRQMRPEWTLCAFVDGRLATTYAAWPFTQRLNGRALPVAAVTQVGTHPLFRRRGFLRTIITRDLHARHEREDAPIAILWASLAAIYQRYGYAVVTRQHRYTIEPRYLQFAVPLETSGTLRPASEEEFPLLVDLYRRFRERRTGLLHRGRALWEHNALAPAPAGGARTIAIYEENGETLGYGIYRTAPGHYPEPGPGQQLEIAEVCWLTPAAYRVFWEHLANFDLVREIVWQRAPDDDPLPYLLQEPRMLNATLRDAILARIIDIDRAFAGRGYDAEGGFVFAAEDDLCPWNAGTWELSAAPEGAELRRANASPLFRAPIGTLAQLLYGTLSATEAWRMGRLASDAPEKLRDVDRLLATAYRPWCPDHF